MLLDKGLNFFPTPGYYEQKQLQQDWTIFDRKIKLKVFFQTNGSTIKNQLVDKGPSFETRSSLEPSKNHHPIETFINTVKNDIEKVT